MAGFCCINLFRVRLFSSGMCAFSWVSLDKFPLYTPSSFKDFVFLQESITLVAIFDVQLMQLPVGKNLLKISDRIGI